jgi:hypothetical protein
MNLQSLVVVALRLMALNLALQAGVLTAPQLMSIYLPDPVHGGLHWSVFSVLGLLLIVAFLSLVAAIWVFAVPVARLVTKALPQDVSFGSLSLVDCYSVAFLGVGLYYMAGHLAQAANWTFYLFRESASASGDTWKNGLNWYQVWSAFVPFLVGVLLFVKGRAWAVMLARKHQDAEASSSSPDPVSRSPELP